MKSKLSKYQLAGMSLSLILVSTGWAEPTKKGIGLWEFEGAAKSLKELDVSWCYNWGVNAPTGLSPNMEFVAMIWDETQVTSNNLRNAKKQSSILLAFNEPDHQKQANMSVSQALDLWPQLEATGMRLGSPATASGADHADGWFGEFMTRSMQKGYRVDFICVHYYAQNFTDPLEASRKLEEFLKRVFALYQKPIWLTEFALSNWKSPAEPDQQKAYMEVALPMLEDLPFLERYAWFALPPNPDGDEGALIGSSLSDNHGNLNLLGEFYKKTRF